MAGHFLRGAMVLTMAGLVSKVIGALYRIPLARLIGGEGIGLYQMAYPIYTLMLALSTAGVPVAISILVAEHQARGDGAGARRVFRLALTLLAFTGGLFAVGLFFSAYYLSERVLHEPRAFYPVVALSPAIFLTAVMSAFRGYFQGNQDMAPTASSQVVEQVFRVGTVLVAAYLLLPSGVEFAAAGATFGAVVGSTAGLLWLLFLYIRHWFRRGNPPSGVRHRKVYTQSTMGLLWRITAIAVPLSLGGIIMPVMQIIDASMVPLRLQAAGHSAARATELFGQLTGMAGTLINLPAIITISLAVSLVPAVAEARAAGQWTVLHTRLEDALRITVMLTLPAAVGLAVLAAPIGYLLYDLPEVGVSLAMLAPAVLFVGLYQTTAGALQGMNYPSLPVISLLAGAVVKVVLNYTLTVGWGVRGAAAATVAAFLTAFWLNDYRLKKIMGKGQNWSRLLLKPGLAVTIMAMAVNWLFPVVSSLAGERLAVLVAVAGGAVVYGLGLLLMGAVRRDEVAMLPGIGPDVAHWLAKYGLVRR